MICGTRGNPDTVAPFRAWRGSRDLVAQSPKFHAPAVGDIPHDCNVQSNTHKLARFQARVVLALRFSQRRMVTARAAAQGFGFAAGAAGASGGSTSAGFTQFTLKGPAP